MQSTPFLTDAIFTLDQASKMVGDIRATVGFVKTAGGLTTEQLHNKQLRIDSYLQALQELVNATEFDFQGKSSSLWGGSFEIEHSAASVAAIVDCQVSEVDLVDGAAKTIVIDIEQQAQPAELLISEAAFGAGLGGDVVFEVYGNRGHETFGFEAGSSCKQICAMINLFSIDTGVDAKITPAGLRLRSLDYGSAAYAELSIVSEHAAGKLAESANQDRVYGKDAIASINGIPAIAEASRLSIQTTKLALQVQLQHDHEGTVQFTISGGGVRLASEFASRKDTRLGLISLQPSKLGGPSGRLYETGSGQQHALTESPNHAFAIATEAEARIELLREHLKILKERELDALQELCNPAPVESQQVTTRRSFPNYDLSSEKHEATPKPKLFPQILVQSGASVLDFPEADADLFTRR